VPKLLKPAVMEDGEIGMIPLLASPLNAVQARELRISLELVNLIMAVMSVTPEQLYAIKIVQQ